MNWLQILTLIVQSAPQLEQASVDTVQLITAISHAAAQNSDHGPIVSAAAALKPKS